MYMGVRNSAKSDCVHRKPQNLYQNQNSHGNTCRWHYSSIQGRDRRINYMAYQSTSTSLVLKNPDLLQIIFEFFDLCNLECIMSIHSSWIQRRTRQSLLWAALTSKAFLEPAMNALWYEMDSILPLYLVLPALRKELQGDLDKENQGSESECVSLSWVPEKDKAPLTSM